MGLHSDAGALASSTVDVMDVASNIPTSVTNRSTIQDPANACVPDLTNAYIDLPLNLFTDFDASFNFSIDPSSWYYKSPFSPDLSGFSPFDLLGDSPSTKSSNSRHINLQHGHDDAMDTDPMPKPSNHQAEAISLLPSNDSDFTHGSISHTITQLLTRCM